MCSIVAQIARGTVYVLDEIVLRHATTAEACQEFLSRYPSHSAGVVVYGDASGNAQHTTGGSDYQIVREYFKLNFEGSLQYRVPKANPNVRDRMALTNAKLRNANGEIKFFIDGKCKELIKDFEQVCYKPGSNEPDKDKDRQRTHASDAVGYVLWQECRPLQSIGFRNTRLL